MDVIVCKSAIYVFSSAVPTFSLDVVRTSAPLGVPR